MSLFDTFNSLKFGAVLSTSLFLGCSQSLPKPVATSLNGLESEQGSGLIGDRIILNAKANFDRMERYTYLKSNPSIVMSDGMGGVVEFPRADSRCIGYRYYYDIELTDHPNTVLNDICFNSQVKWGECHMIATYLGKDTEGAFRFEDIEIIETQNHVSK